MVVKLGRFVKGQIRPNRLVVNEQRDVLLDEVRLDRSNPLRGAAKQLAQYQHCGHEDRRPKYGAPTPASTNGCSDSVHERPGQIDGSHWKKSLDEKKQNPDC